MNEQKSLDAKPLNEASFVLPANDGPTLPNPKSLDFGPNSVNPKILSPVTPPPGSAPQALPGEPAKPTK